MNNDNNHGGSNVLGLPEEPVIEAEVAPDIEEVVQEEVQRVVQEVFFESSSSQRPPLAIVVASERPIVKPPSIREDPENNDRICGFRRPLVYWALAVVAVVAIVCGGILATASSNNDQPHLDEMVPTMTPSMAPTSVMNALYPFKTLEDLSAAQYNATVWITMEDALEFKTTTQELLERHALATLYFGLNNNNNSTLIGWLSNDHHCQWESVKCNNDTAVIALDLHDRRLVGSMPAEIGRLSNLEELSLGKNRIMGELPKELYYGLTKLTQLAIGDTLLTTFGTDIGRLTTLRMLYGVSGRFQSLPSEIGNLTSLEVLDMVDGNSNATLPKELGRLTSLVTLSLASNQFRGTIPNLSALSNLIFLSLAHNKFTGQIPPLGEMTSLTWLTLNDNRLEGSLPEGLNNSIPLVHFNTANNSIGSTIPPPLFGMGSLTSLDLSHNLLSGTLPTEQNLASLWNLNLEHNRLSSSIPSSLATITSLRNLNLAYNQLISTLPTELGKLYPREFDVRGNQLQGSVPESLNGWLNIRTAFFSSNNFTSGLENLFCNKNRYGSLRDFEADCELDCNCCTACE